jgi:hypothetical protein
MVQIIYSADWFYAAGIFIDILAAVVLLLLGIAAWRFFAVSKERSYTLLASSFAILAVSFFTKAIFEWLLHETVVEGETHLLFLNDSLIALPMLATLYAYRILLVVGLYVLYAVYEQQSFRTVLLVSAFLSTLVVVSKEVHFVFHGATLLLFLAITLSLVARPAKNSLSVRIITYSFAALTANRLFLTFASFSPALYIVATSIQLVAFAAILYAFLNIHHATPPLKARHHS